VEVMGDDGVVQVCENYMDDRQQETSRILFLFTRQGYK